MNLASTAILMADNVQCIRMLTDHGLLNALVPAAGHNMAFTRLDTATHWGLAVNSVNQPVESDNGYVIFLIPKDAGTFEQAMMFFSECIAGCDMHKGGDIHVRDIKVESKDWN